MEIFDYVRARDVGAAGLDDEDTGDIGGAWKNLRAFLDKHHLHTNADVDRALKSGEITQADIAKAKGDFGKQAFPAGALDKAATTVAHVAQKGLKTITNNPLWKIAQTGMSFIPGIGTAVSAGMASAAAIGRGESLKDIGLAAARGALPAPAQVAMDVAIGALKHQNLGAMALREVRSQLPGGDIAKGAFDAAIAIAHGHPPDVVNALRSQLGGAAKDAFDLAIHASKNPTVPTPVAAASALSPLTGGTSHKLAAVRHALPQPGRRTSVRPVPVKRKVPSPQRPFPHLPQGANKAAAMLIANPSLRASTPRTIGNLAQVDTRDVQSAIASFLQRFGASRELDYRDVGEFETIDQAAQRHGVCCENLGEWPSDTAAVHVMQMPPVPLSRAHLHAIYQRGDGTIKRALLAHELLAHVARNTGELDGTVWVVQANGDWPYNVAQKVVGDGNRWKEILPLNPQLKLQSNGNIPQWVKGARIQLPPSWIPSAVPVPSATPTPVVLPALAPVLAPAPILTTSSAGGPPFPAPSTYPAGYPSSIYTIKSGDTGEKVAEMITGDKNRWRELLVTNPSLKDPTYGIALYTGKTLTLPSNWVKPQATPEVLVASLPAPAPAPTLPPPVLGTTPATLPAAASGGTWIPSAGTFGAPVSPPAPVPAPAPAPVTTSDTPVVTGSAEQIGAVQIMLAAFYRDHPEATWTLSSGGVFGWTAEDLAGVWDDRTRAAFLGFEKWWNSKGKTPTLVADGLPDADAVAALVQQSIADGAPLGSAAQIGLTVGGVTQKPAFIPRPAAPAAKQASSGGDSFIPVLGLLLAALGT